MSGLMDQVIHLLKLEAIDENPDLEFIQKKTGVKPSAIVIAVIVFLLIVTLISNATTLVVGIGCYCFPAYFTFLAVENRKNKNQNRYLLYWTVYGLVQIISFLLELVLTSTFYILTRFIIALIILHPQSPATDQIMKFVKPFLDNHQDRIDNDINNALQKEKKIVDQALQFEKNKLF